MHSPLLLRLLTLVLLLAPGLGLAATPLILRTGTGEAGDTLYERTVTADPATDTLTAVAHPFAAGRLVSITTTGTLPGGLAAGVEYYVVNPAADTLQLAAASGGPALDLTSAGTGTHTLGQWLTHGEVDANFRAVRDGVERLTGTSPAQQVKGKWHVDTDPAITDHGGAAAGSLKAILTQIGASAGSITLSARETPYACTTAVTIPANVSLIVEKGAVLSGTITINGPLSAGPYRIFAAGSAVVLGAGFGGEALLDWWGALPDGLTTATDNSIAIQEAINVMQFTRGALVSAPGVYNYATGLVIIGQLTWTGPGAIGLGVPRFNYTGTDVAVTVGNGTDYVYALYLRNLAFSAADGTTASVGILSRRTSQCIFEYVMLGGGTTSGKFTIGHRLVDASILFIRPMVSNRANVLGSTAMLLDNGPIGNTEVYIKNGSFYQQDTIYDVRSALHFVVDGTFHEKFDYAIRFNAPAATEIEGEGLVFTENDFLATDTTNYSNRKIISGVGSADKAFIVHNLTFDKNRCFLASPGVEYPIRFDVDTSPFGSKARVAVKNNFFNAANTAIAFSDSSKVSFSFEGYNFGQTMSFTTPANTAGAGYSSEITYTGDSVGIGQNNIAPLGTLNIKDGRATGATTLRVDAGANQGNTNLVMMRDGGGNTIFGVMSNGSLFTVNQQGHFYYNAIGQPYRWLEALAGTESGSDSGSDWTLFRYDDSGIFRGTPIVAKRNTGRVGISYNSPSAVLHVVNQEAESTPVASFTRKTSQTAPILQATTEGFGPLYTINADGSTTFTGRGAADPSAPSSANGVLYVRDNGAGKAQLCVRFATGAVQVLATEP